MYIPTLDFNKHLIPEPLMWVEYSWHVRIKQISKKDDTSPSNKCKTEQDQNFRISPPEKQVDVFLSDIFRGFNLQF